jgi:hypothetical protein
MSDDLRLVVVRRVPFGELTFPFCVADVFEADSLTITVSETQAVIHVFERSTWVDATVFDASGHELYVVQSDLGRQRAAHTRMARAVLATKPQQEIA